MPHKEEYSEFQFKDLPAFPDSSEFPTVPLETISLTKLLHHDQDEEERTFEAMKARGFFYLDLSGCEEGETISKGSEDIARVGENFMALPTDEKMQYTPRQKELFG